MEYILNAFGLVNGQKVNEIKHIEIINKMKLVTQREALRSKKQVEKLKAELYNMLLHGKKKTDADVIRKASVLTRNMAIREKLDITYNSLCIIGDNINTNSQNINIIKKFSEFTPILEEINESIQVPQIMKISSNLQRELKKLNNKTEMIEEMMESIEDQSLDQEQEDLSEDLISEVLDEITKEFELKMAENKPPKNKKKKKETQGKMKSKHVVSNNGSSSSNPRNDAENDDD